MRILALFVLSSILVFGQASPNGVPNQTIGTASTNSATGQYAPGTITSAGTGAVARSPQAKALDIISVKDFGALGDGSTNEAPAIQAAIAAAIAANIGTVYFPSGVYHITSSLSVINLNAGSLNLVGAGQTDVGSTHATVIKGDTGNVIIDTTGSQFVTIRNMSLQAGTTTPAVIGVLWARSSTSVFAQFNVLQNVSIYMGTNSAANSSHGTVAVYNYGDELSNTENCYFRADNPIVVANDNIFTVTSPNTTILGGGGSSVTSMATTHIKGSTAVSSLNYGLKLYGAINLTTENLYLLCSSCTAAFPVDITGVTDIHLGVDTEGWNQLVHVVGSADHVYIRSYINPASTIASLVVLDGSTAFCTSMSNSEISVATPGGQPSHYLLDYTSTNICGVRGMDINLGSSQGIHMDLGLFSAMIRAFDNAPTITITGEPFGAYILMSGQGKISIQGDVTQLGAISMSGSTATVASGASAGTSPTVSISQGHPNSGLLNVTTGTSTTTSGTVATITFPFTLASAPACLIEPASTATSALAVGAQPFASATSTTTFTLTAGGTALAASTAYKWWYHCF